MRTSLPIWCVLVAVVVGFGMQVGCRSSDGRWTMVPPDLVQSSEERAHTWKSVIDTDFKAMQQDIDMWLMLDRPTRLTRWRVQ